MSKIKYYFETIDSEMCYSEQYFIDQMKESEVKEMQVFEAVPEKSDEYFYCTAIGDVGEKGHCGKDCKDYEPCNGKSGRCRFTGRLYIHGNKVLLTIK